MLYLPDSKYLEHFKILAWALPPKLLPWLYRRGLGIYVLPPYEAGADEIVYKRLHIRERVMGPDDDRLAHQTAHYQTARKAIIIPYVHFLGQHSASVFLHEIGHAIDFLYYGNRLLCEHPPVKKALHPGHPFNEYCQQKDAASGKPIEQFATGFAAFFQETTPGDAFPSITALSPEFISIIRTTLVVPFEENSGT